MPRRYKPERRVPAPDLKYGNVHVAMFVNRIMKGGKKSTARTVLYNSFDLVADRSSGDPIEVFETALKTVMPRVEVKARRVGGSTYQVPTEVSSDRQMALSMQWLIAAARARSGKSMAEKLASEFMDAAKGQGSAVKKRDDTHRMAEANRAFASFRF